MNHPSLSAEYDSASSNDQCHLVKYKISSWNSREFRMMGGGKLYPLSAKQCKYDLMSNRKSNICYPNDNTLAFCMYPEVIVCCISVTMSLETVGHPYHGLSQMQPIFLNFFTKSYRPCRVHGSCLWR